MPRQAFRLCSAGVAAGGSTVGVAAAPGGAATGAFDGCRSDAPSSNAMTSPSLTLSPTLTFSSRTTPPADDGISIDALSLSIVISDCSAATVSPTLTSSSMTSTSLKSPMSGTATSTGPPSDEAGSGVGAGAGDAAGGCTRPAAAASGAAVASDGTACVSSAADLLDRGFGAAGVAASSASAIASNEPSLTLSPTLTFSSVIVPPLDAGISIDALSLSIVMSDCSASTRRRP